MATTKQVYVLTRCDRESTEILRVLEGNLAEAPALSVKIAERRLRGMTVLWATGKITGMSLRYGELEITLRITLQPMSVSRGEAGGFRELV